MKKIYVVECYNRPTLFRKEEKIMMASYDSIFGAAEFLVDHMSIGVLTIIDLFQKVNETNRDGLKQLRIQDDFEHDTWVLTEIYLHEESSE